MCPHVTIRQRQFCSWLCNRIQNYKMLTGRVIQEEFLYSGSKLACPQEDYRSGAGTGRISNDSRLLEYLCLLRRMFADSDRIAYGNRHQIVGHGQGT